MFSHQRAEGPGVILKTALRDDADRVGAVGQEEVVIACRVGRGAGFASVEDVVVVGIVVDGPASADGGLAGIFDAVSVVVDENISLRVPGQGPAFADGVDPRLERLQGRAKGAALAGLRTVGHSRRGKATDHWT